MSTVRTRRGPIRFDHAFAKSVPVSSVNDTIPAVITNRQEDLVNEVSRTPRFSGMRPRWPSTLASSGQLCLFTLIVPYVANAIGPYPVPPDVHACSPLALPQRPLGHRACQAAVDSLPRGILPSIFTTRAHTATNNYIQVPVQYTDAEPEPSCIVTIDLEGHSQNDQFVFVPWNEIRDMAQIIIGTCVDLMSRGGFITYGVGRTFESLIHPTAYGNNDEIPAPAWVWQPDGTVEFVAIPSLPATNEYSKFCGTTLSP